jgi:hypothetical protein
MMKNISIGITIGVIISIIIISFFPIPETDQACGKCGAKAWYFQVAEGEE